MKELIKSYEIISLQNNQYKRNSIIAEKYSGYFLDVDTYISNRNGGKVTLSEILNDNVNFLFYIPPITCSSCNTNIYNNLPKAINTLGQKLKIIGSIYDMNSIVVYSKNSTTDNTLFYPIDDKEFRSIKIAQPYLLKVNNHGQILSVFIIEDNNIDLFNEVIESFLK